MAFPGELNINYYKGDTYEFSIYPKNADGSAMNLTNYLPQFTISLARGTAPELHIALSSIKKCCVTYIL